jgi:hypothetical protein
MVTSPEQVEAPVEAPAFDPWSRTTGITGGTVPKFSHDNFLRMQDPDLGWIRNVMRVAGTECDVRPYDEPERLRKHHVTQRAGKLG